MFKRESKRERKWVGTWQKENQRAEKWRIREKKKTQTKNKPTTPRTTNNEQKTFSIIFHQHKNPFSFSISISAARSPQFSHVFRMVVAVVAVFDAADKNQPRSTFFSGSSPICVGAIWRLIVPVFCTRFHRLRLKKRHVTWIFLLFSGGLFCFNFGKWLCDMKIVSLWDDWLFGNGPAVFSTCSFLAYGGNRVKWSRVLLSIIFSVIHDEAYSLHVFWLKCVKIFWNAASRQTYPCRRISRSQWMDRFNRFGMAQFSPNQLVHLNYEWTNCMTFKSIRKHAFWLWTK